MHFTPTFYRAAAIASVLSAVTTLGLIFLPQMLAPAGDFASRMVRVNDPVYRLYSWVYLVHPFITVTAALGVAMRLRREAASLVIPGLLGFLLWGATEAAQQTFTLMAFNPWRLAWLAGDPAVRATMDVRVAVYDGIWNAMFLLLLIAFFIGNLAYSAAMWRGRGLTRVVGVFYVAAALLTLSIVLGELGVPTIPGPVEFWIYPLTQPLARTLIGVWLWRYRDEGTGPVLQSSS